MSKIVAAFAVVAVVVAVAGAGLAIHTFGVPFSSDSLSGGCCAESSPCCTPACCSEGAPCCEAGAECCTPDCCTEEPSAKPVSACCDSVKKN